MNVNGRMVSRMNKIFSTQDRWSLTKGEYFRLVDEHKKAHERNDKRMMNGIEDWLEDINYYPECIALSEFEYDKAKKLWDEEFE